MAKPFENLMTGVHKIESAPESLITFLRGLMAEFRASTNDANVHALVERATASIDPMVESVFANTSAAQRKDEPTDEQRAADEQAKKDAAGKAAPANVVSDNSDNSDKDSENKDLNSDRNPDKTPTNSDKPVLSEDVPTDNIPGPDAPEPNEPPNPAPSATTPTTGSASGGATEAAPPVTPMEPNLSTTSAPAQAEPSSFASFSHHVDEAE